jgi:hypothetical protein
MHFCSLGRRAPVIAPLGKNRVDDGLERLGDGSDRTLHALRRLGDYLPANQFTGFELAKLPCQPALGDTRDRTPQLPEAMDAAD